MRGAAFLHATSQMAWRGLLHGPGPVPSWVYPAFIGGKVVRTWALFDADDVLSVSGVPVAVFSLLVTAFAAALYMGTRVGSRVAGGAAQFVGSLRQGPPAKQS